MRSQIGRDQQKALDLARQIKSGENLGSLSISEAELLAETLIEFFEAGESEGIMSEYTPPKSHKPLPVITE